MKLEKKEIRSATVEGYRVLLRAVANLELPTEYERISRFYLLLSEKCISWATEVSGERLRNEYLSMESTMQKARFPICSYLISMRCQAFLSDEYAVILYEIRRNGGDGVYSFRRLSHVWLLSEQTALPPKQILKLLSVSHLPHDLGFAPDGIYPENSEVVFYKNASEKNKFMEKRYAIDNFGNL